MPRGPHQYRAAGEHDMNTSHKSAVRGDTYLEQLDVSIRIVVVGRGVGIAGLVRGLETPQPDILDPLALDVLPGVGPCLIHRVLVGELSFSAKAC